MVSATLTQPLPRHAPGRLPLRALLDALRGNALAAFPREAFFEDVVVQNFFGRRHVILSRPDAIHHVLVDLGTRAKTELPSWIRAGLEPFTVRDEPGGETPSH